ncbi:hypothetical protein [Neisseria iguanae]|nr:hypothetical protein [Neisseria iguanae]
MWFTGDRMCLREQYAAKNMHRLKQLALNLINRDKSVKRRISSKRLMAAEDFENALKNPFFRPSVKGA